MKKFIWLFCISVVVLLAQIENTHAATQETSNSSAILKAAEQGDARAQVLAGVMYHSGKDVQKDYAQAAQWFQKAASQGNPDAQFFLGMMYRKGEGVLQDNSKALQWYKRAADQGHDEAQFNLGAIYDSGQIVPKDHTNAALWFQKSAVQGNASAQFRGCPACFLILKGVVISSHETNRFS